MATAVVALGIAFYYSWELTLVTLAIVPLSTSVLIYLSSKISPLIAAQQDLLSAAAQTTTNALSAIETVKSLNGQDVELPKFEASILSAGSYYVRQTRIVALQFGFVRFVSLIMFAGPFWFGNHLVHTGKKPAGSIVTTFWSCLAAMQAIEAILPQALVMFRGRVAAAVLTQLTSPALNGDTPYESKGGKHVIKHESFHEDILFHKVRSCILSTLMIANWAGRFQLSCPPRFQSAS